MSMRWEDYEGLARKIAWGALRSAPSNLGLTLDDLVQEAAIAFVKACEGYSSDKGAEFSTYFYQAAQRRLWRVVSKSAKGFSTVSLDDHRGEEGRELHEAVPDDAPTPERRIEERQAFESALEGLSPLARTVFVLSVEPDEIVRGEFEAFQARQRFGLEQGISRVVPADITPTFVMKVLRLPSRRRALVNAELRRFKETFHAVAT